MCLNHHQIYPSFFQAPSASEALLPDGLVFSKGQLPIVTIAFCAPDQAGLRCGCAGACFVCLYVLVFTAAGRSRELNPVLSRPLSSKLSLCQDACGAAFECPDRRTRPIIMLCCAVLCCAASLAVPSPTTTSPPPPQTHRPVDALSRRAAKQALEMFCSAVRTTLNACQGYECQEKDGIFMLAFSEAGVCLWGFFVCFWSVCAGMVCCF